MIDEDLQRKLDALRRAGLARSVHGDATGAADALTGALQAEIRSEQAAAYGRAVRKVEQAVAALAAAGTTLLEAGPDDVAEARRAWRERREEALYARWELAVHREALGLLRQADVEEQFPVPTSPPR